jgi:hypothetical protein
VPSVVFVTFRDERRHSSPPRCPLAFPGELASSIRKYHVSNAQVRPWSFQDSCLVRYDMDIDRGGFIYSGRPVGSPITKVGFTRRDPEAYIKLRYAGIVQLENLMAVTNAPNA